jgi:hypothetical protein
MRIWQQRLRIIVIAAASFVILVTVLPQVASGFGLRSLENRLESTTATSCSGSGSSAGSGSSSSCAPKNGTVTGSVKILGKPKGFHPATVGAEACAGAVSAPCSNPVSTVATKKMFTLSLTAGDWTVFGYYQITSGGAVFVGNRTAVNVPAGGTVTVELLIFYETPAKLAGTLTVNGASANDPITTLTVVVCPLSVAFSGGTVPNGCASGSATPSTAGGATGSYLVKNLAPGSWTAYPGFCALSGCVTHTGDKQAATLKSGKKTLLDLSTSFLEPNQALLYGTVSVLLAPRGFSATLGANACQVGGACESVNAVNGKYATILTNVIPAFGAWTAQGFYVKHSGTRADGLPLPFVAVAGTSTQLGLTVLYQGA